MPEKNTDLRAGDNFSRFEVKKGEPLMASKFNGLVDAVRRSHVNLNPGRRPSSSSDLGVTGFYVTAGSQTLTADTTDTIDCNGETWDTIDAWAVASPDVFTFTELGYYLIGFMAVVSGLHQITSFTPAQGCELRLKSVSLGGFVGATIAPSNIFPLTHRVSAFSIAKFLAGDVMKLEYQTIGGPYTLTTANVFAQRFS